MMTHSQRMQSKVELYYDILQNNVLCCVLLCCAMLGHVTEQHKQSKTKQTRQSNTTLHCTELHYDEQYSRRYQMFSLTATEQVMAAIFSNQSTLIHIILLSPSCISKFLISLCFRILCHCYDTFLFNFYVFILKFDMKKILFHYLTQHARHDPMILY